MKTSTFPLLALLAFTLAGCATSLGDSWTDFRARYNTYYNASQRFQAGMDRFERGEFHLENDRLVRIHPSLSHPEQPDFSEAVVKAETILRRFPESRWADDALYIAARSHYYLEEYFQALSRLEQLEADSEADPRLRNLAVIWTSRVLFELDRHAEAAQYLEERIADLPARPDRNIRAEAKAQLAEHYIRTGDWERARELLGEASSELHEGEVRSRTLFLFGQVLERMGGLQEAYFAYANVSQGFPEYEYVLWSRIKQAQISRQTGDLEQAQQTLVALRRDDKNVGHIGLIDLEIARTLEEQGNLEEAEERYRRVLRGGDTSVRPAVRSRAYYRLGLLFARYHGRYTVAAAYFDSAATLGQGSSSYGSGLSAPGAPPWPPAMRTEGEAGWEAADPAAAYRRYAMLKERSRHLDSLLWLGSLPAAQRDSVVAEVRRRKLEDLKQSRNRESEILYEPVSEGQEGGDERPLFGFLNHRNPDLVARSRSRFRAYWGDRPLVDHWRRAEMVPSSAAPPETGGETADPQTTPEMLQVELDLGAIPLTDRQRDSLRTRRANLYLELGNLFFLELQQPDSAANYYRRLLRERPGSDLARKALYSLAELYRERDMADSLQAARRRYRAEFGEDLPGPGDGRRVTTDAAETILADSTRTLQQRARELADLARSRPDDPRAPAWYFRAIESYIEMAREGEPAAPDTLAVDTAEVPGIPAYRYRGAAWDTVRTHLRRYGDLFPGSGLSERAGALLDVLQQTRDEQRYRCAEADAPLTIRGGLEAFMAEVRFPDSVRGMSLEGEITYHFMVDREGRVEKYRLVSPETGLGLEGALEEAFEEHLRFNPFEVEGRPVPVDCRFTFPVDL